jgi:hypothetical protein
MPPRRVKYYTLLRVSHFLVFLLNLKFGCVPNLCCNKKWSLRIYIGGRTLDELVS